MSSNFVKRFKLQPLSSSHASLMELLESRKDVSDFLTLIKAALLDSNLINVNETRTILAPNNQLLRRLINQEKQKTLLNNRKQLTAFVTSHFIKGKKEGHLFYRRLKSNDFVYD